MKPWETLIEIMPTLKNYPKLNDHLSSEAGGLAPGGVGMSPRVSTFTVYLPGLSFKQQIPLN